MSPARAPDPGSFFPFSGGLVDRPDPRQLGPGDLVSAVGVEYREGSQNVHTTGMRAAAGTFGALAHTGLAYAQYDSAASKLIAGSSTGLQEATIATSGMVGSVVQLDSAPLTYNSTPDALVSRMDRERLYLATGIGIDVTINSIPVTRRQNVFRKSDGTWLLQSLLPPTTTPTVAAQALTASLQSPNSNSGSWTNPANAQDTDDATRAQASLAIPGTVTHTWTFGAFTASGHKLKVLHGGGALPPSDADAPEVGIGGGAREPLVANLKIEYSTNSGGAFTTLSDRPIAYATSWSEFAIPNGSYSGAQLQVKATLTYTSGSIPATGFVNTIKALAAASSFPSAPLGFYYLVTEWDGTNAKESAYSPPSDKVTLNGTTQNAVLVTLPTAKQNNRSTHWRIYRTPEGAAQDEFDKYGLIGEVPITATTFLDTFEKPLTEVAVPVLRVLTVGQGDDLTFYPLDAPVPLASSIDFYKGSLLLVPVDDAGNVYYTPPYDPENRPALYAIPSRTSRNDRAIAVRTVDDVWLIFFRNWVRRVQGLPLVVNGLFDAANYAEASTSRGIVGPLALDNITNLEGDGTTWLVALDDKGLYITNGYLFKPWSINKLWAGLLAAAHLAKTIVFVNQDRRRVEVYYVPFGSTTRTRRLDFYYGEMRADGQPRISGPHLVNCNGVISATISGVEERFTANGTTGQGGGATAGAVYREDSGNSDESRAYNASQHVQRSVVTGDLPIAGLGEDGYCRSLALRTVRGSYATITETASLKFSSGEVRTSAHTLTPSAPDPMPVFAAGETLSYQFDDTGTTEKAEVLGLYVETEPMGGRASALRASVSASATSRALPTS